MPITFDFTDKTVFITGAGSGIGRATAEAFAAAGADVAVTGAGTTEVPLRETAQLVEAHGRRAHVALCDVTDSKNVEDAVASTVDALGSIDIGVNNAGIEQPPKPLAETSDEEWDRLIGRPARGVLVHEARDPRHGRTRRLDRQTSPPAPASSASRARPRTPPPSTASSA